MSALSANHIFALLAAASAITLAGCDGADVEINGQKGVPLSEIEIAGAPPEKVISAVVMQKRNCLIE